MLPSRQRILDAAARVYAQHGFRGATTRRIADEAGVNEITVFRQFGSKDALINEAIRCCASAVLAQLPALPAAPADPEAELTAWAAAHLAHLRANRALIRKTMSELEEHPEVGECSRAAPVSARRELCAYVERVRAHALADDGDDATGRREVDEAAVTMLMAALFSDAMGRDVMPEMYGVPAERAPALYVRIFLRAVGAGSARGDRPRRDGGAPHPPLSPTSTAT